MNIFSICIFNFFEIAFYLAEFDVFIVSSTINFTPIYGSNKINKVKGSYQWSENCFDV